MHTAEQRANLGFKDTVLLKAKYLKNGAF